MKFIVESGDGLTRRLVDADDARAARVEFLQAVPRGNVLSVPYDAVKVYEATPEHLAEFRKKRKAKFDSQLALDLQLETPRGMKRGPKQQRKSRKEHA